MLRKLLGLLEPELKTVPGTWGELCVEGGEGEPRAEADIDEQARELLALMSLDEKTHQMSGDTPLLRGLLDMARAYNARPLPAGENFRLGIPGIRFGDGPRGAVIYRSTCFPVPMARGASWDVELEERIGDAIGVELRTQGANFFGGVCINLLRHPGWGRAQETYGEDPYHLGEMGAALVRGSQRHVMACVKHFAANSIENARFRVDVRMDERTLHEVYLPHFKRCVDEGVAAVMSAYNRLNGPHCGHNRRLLRSILKDGWGFRGFVMSDFVFGVRDATAVTAGVDVEMPFTLRFGRRLRRAVRRGLIDGGDVDDAVLRLLRQKIRFAGIGKPDRYVHSAVAGPAHRALAREAAVKSIVLLKNDPPPRESAALLPIDLSAPVRPAGPARLARLAVIGPLANRPCTGDKGSSRVRPPHVVTPLEGVRAAVGESISLDFDDGSDPACSAQIAREADTVLLAVGYTHRDEGERIDMGWKRFGGDRSRLELPADQEELIRSVCAAQPRTVVVLFGGSAIITESWRERPAAILMAWYAGMEGGHALADILFGRANPSAKLPCSFPRSTRELPLFDPTAPSIAYGYLHGYRLLDHQGHDPAYPFGFGLSYTTFAYENLRTSAEVVAGDESLEIRVDVTNTGTRAGEEIVQMYAGCPASRVTRAPRALVGFEKIALAPAQRRTVALELPARALAYYEPDARGWVVEPGKYRIEVGPCSRRLLAAVIEYRTGAGEIAPDLT